MGKDMVNHDGIVVEISDSKVIAEILVSEACGTCQAKGLCHTQGKKVKIEAPVASDSDLAVGDSVVVSMKSSMAMSSVLLAYVAPLALMFAVMFAIIGISGNQDAGSLAGLATLPVYYWVLYKHRARLRRQFSFEVSKR